MKDKEIEKKSGRRGFLEEGLKAGLGLIVGTEKSSETVKMLDKNGKLVEIPKGAVISKKGNQNKDILDWSANPSVNKS